MMWMYVVLGVVVLAGAGYFVFMNKNTTSKSETTMQPVPTQEQQVPIRVSNETGVEAEKIVVSGDEFKFTPAKLTLKAGKPVELTFNNTGTFPHNLVFAGMDVKTETIKPGETTSITFTPDKTGTFDFSCTVGSHAEKGMKGTLTVE